MKLDRLQSHGGEGPKTLLSNRPQLFAIAAAVAIILTFIVRWRFELEAQTLLTGVVLTGPLVAAAGMTWSDELGKRGLAGPRAKFAVPDFEQILEGLAVLFAGLITYWLLLNGPSENGGELTGLNALANDFRNFRREDGTPATNLVPTGFTWFVIGAILSAPFWMSFGSMAGRELIARAERRSGAVQTGTIGEFGLTTDEG